ncbi:MAG: ABC transporter ATP-binding protein [Anaerolineae bacterium]|nr:ABC transporter ATP-binding protein [Anaerolineae bacterium]MDW8100235.1 ABC transporter ATP-binding protein [Anaerolineae bacterium]
MQAIVVERLTKRFGSFVAVNGISFVVREGEIFGFLGPNGSGKTTTIRMLLGLLRPSSGRALVLSYDVAREASKIRRQAGYMSQRFSLYDDLTVEENLNFYGGTYGLQGRQLKERKRFVLEMAGLVGRERELTRHLAGGWKQRLALGAAILHQPRILFLDEPTAGVDPLSRRQFWELLYQLAEGGTTIFVTTHYMDEAEHCHRLAFMHRGNLVAQGTPAEIKTQQMRAQVMEIECMPSDAALSVLRSLNSFDEVALYGTRIHVIAPEVAQMEAVIRQALSQAGVHIAEMMLIPPSLEDVFISRIR